MSHVRSTVDIHAPLEVVWAAASDLASHHEWMADAESISFETGQRSGVGTKMQVLTRVGPLKTTDLMEVTEWEDGRTIGVRHTGVVSGSGRFELSPLAGGTRFTWTEDLRFPARLGGDFTALLAKPVLALIWRRNLTALKRRVESGFLSPESGL